MSWDKLPGRAVNIAADGHGGTWATTLAGRIFYLPPKGYIWQPIEGSATVIATAGQQVVSLAKDTGKGQRWSGMSWESLGSERLIHITVNMQGSIWAVDTNNNIRKFEGAAASKPQIFPL